MSRRWENDGQPLPDGRICLVIDPEDGTHPLRVYGLTKDEVLDKAAKTVEHGSRTIAELRRQQLPAADNRPPQAPPRRTMTADEQMEATADLSNPARAPEAVRRLVEHATGLDFTQMQREETLKRVATVSMDWQLTHPEFPDSPINKKLILDTASLRVGFANITAPVLEDVYQSLSNSGMLVSVNDEPETVNDNPTTPTPRPSESPESVTVRPRAATSYRRGELKSPVPAAQTSAKYSRAQIDAMTADELGDKMKREPGFAAIVDSYAQSRRA